MEWHVRVIFLRNEFSVELVTGGCNSLSIASTENFIAENSNINIQQFRIKLT